MTLSQAIVYYLIVFAVSVCAIIAGSAIGISFRKRKNQKQDIQIKSEK